MGWLAKTKATPQLSRNEALDCTPVRNRHVSEQRLDSGEILIVYPLAVRPWMATVAKWLGARETLRTGKLQLDLLGSSVWERLDGRTPLRQLAAAFAQEHRLEPKEAQVAVTQFVRELGRRGLVGLR
jgi:hypothetical protein